MMNVLTRESRPQRWQAIASIVLFGCGCCAFIVAAVMGTCILAKK